MTPFRSLASTPRAGRKTFFLRSTLNRSKRLFPRFGIDAETGVGVTGMNRSKPPCFWYRGRTVEPSWVIRTENTQNAFFFVFPVP